MTVTADALSGIDNRIKQIAEMNIFKVISNVILPCVISSCSLYLLYSHTAVMCSLCSTLQYHPHALFEAV